MHFSYQTKQKTKHCGIWVRDDTMCVDAKLVFGFCVLMIGSFKWEIQELLAQGSGEQRDNKKISCFLFVSKK